MKAWESTTWAWRGCGGELMLLKHISMYLICARLTSGANGEWRPAVRMCSCGDAITKMPPDRNANHEAIGPTRDVATTAAHAPPS